MIGDFVIKKELIEEGIRFLIYNKEGNPIPVENWTDITSIISPTDTVIIQILSQLLDEEQAKEAKASVLLPHPIIASLPDSERIALDLPEPFPFDIEIRTSGNIADKDFHYIYLFLNGSSQPFVSPRRIGTHLEITSERSYLLVGELYNLIEAIDKFNNRAASDKGIKDNLLEFAKIKGLANNIGAELDIYMNNEQVIAPSKLSLRLKRIDNETVEIEPVFCKEISDDEGNPINQPIMDDLQNSSFLNTFDRLKERELYALPDGPRIVLDEKQKEALGKVKRFRRVSGREKDVVLQNPQSFFDPDVIDFDLLLKEGDELTTWSDRVIKIDEYRPKVFPFLQPNKEAWLPPEGGIIIDDTRIYISPDDAIPLKQSIEEAQKTGEKTVLWKDQAIPVTDEVLKSVEQLIEIRPSKETTTEETNKSHAENQDKKGVPNILIIKDNFEDSIYKPGNQVRPGKISIPKCLKGGRERLLPHQQEGLKWLQSLWIGGARGALLADDMGLGKTLQALAFMGWVREIMQKGMINKGPMLIAAPVGLMENWKEEYGLFLAPIFGPFLELHGTGLQRFKSRDTAKRLGITKEIEIKDKDNAEKIISAHGGLLLNHKEIEKAEVVITTYETIRDYQFSLGLIDWKIMVLDETQKIKTPTTMVTTAVKAMKYEFGIALTGTPVENSWVDLWSILDFVQPGQLGSLKEFVKEYHNPLRKEGTDREALGLRLKKIVDPLMKRRMKEDHLDGLTEKHIKSYKVEMPQVQLEQYTKIIKKARETLPDKSGKGRKNHIFNTITALKDTSLHPYLPLYSEQGFAKLSDDEIINSSSRLKKTIEILDEIREKGEKAIVFIISRKMQGILHRLIKNRFAIHSHIINGQVLGGRRKGLVDAFQETNGFNIIIMSPETAGVGLNVTAANHVIHLSRQWNPAKEDQAADRVYRIGQEQPVTIHIPLAVHPIFENEECKGTFDIKLNRLLENKRQMSRSVLMPTVIEDEESQTMGEEIIDAPVGETEQSILNISDVDCFEPEVFEKLIKTLYTKKGYQVELTPQSRDYGADVIAIAHGNSGSSYLVQCKHTAIPERPQIPNGVQEILAAYGVYKKDSSIDFEKVVFTNAECYTSQAVRIASDNGVKLMDRNDLSGWIKEYNVTIGDVI